MILTKGKHNFWSQLLVSMIAIFALPEVTLANNAEYPREYQNQSVQQQTLRAIFQVHQQQRLQPKKSHQHKPQQAKLAEFQPHFVARIEFAHAPIRGSPLA